MTHAAFIGMLPMFGLHMNMDKFLLVLLQVCVEVGMNCWVFVDNAGFGFSQDREPVVDALDGRND